MRRRVATITVTWDEEDDQSSATKELGEGKFLVKITRQSDEFVIDDVGKFQRTLAHELGHVIALVTKDPSHLGDLPSMQNRYGRVEMVHLPAERKAWELAKLILPDQVKELKKEEAESVATYEDALGEIA